MNTNLDLDESTETLDDNSTSEDHLNGEQESQEIDDQTQGEESGSSSPDGDYQDKTLEEKEAEAMDLIIASEQGGNPPINHSPKAPEEEKELPAEGEGQSDGDQDQKDDESDDDSELEKLRTEYEDLKKKVDEETNRRVETQRSFHEKSKLASDLQKKIDGLKEEKDQLAQQIKDFESKTDDNQETNSQGEDSGSNNEKSLDKLKEGLSEDAQEFLEDAPEVAEIIKKFSGNKDSVLTKEEVTSIISDTLKAEREKAESERESAEAERQKQLQKEREQDWERGVLRTYPDYFEVEESEDFKNWVKDHPRTVNRILDGYDDLDSQGAIEIRKAFDKDQKTLQSKEAQREKNIAAASHHPTGKKASIPAGKQGKEKVRSRAQMEADALDLVVQEEERKRRAF